MPPKERKTRTAQEAQAGLQTWFGWLLEWVKGFVQKIGNKGEKKLLTLEVLRATSGKALAESVQRTTPGAVATWYIRHSEHPGVRLIIMVDNLYELQKFIDTTLPNDLYVRTHIISIQWLLKIGKKQKTVYKFSGAWVGDFQGQTSSINAKAFDVARYLTLEIINLLPLPSMNWRYRVSKYMWEDAIASKCKLIGDKHNPRLVKIKQPNLLSPS